MEFLGTVTALPIAWSLDVSSRRPIASRIKTFIRFDLFKLILPFPQISMSARRPKSAVNQIRNASIRLVRINVFAIKDSVRTAANV